MTYRLIALLTLVVLVVAVWRWNASDPAAETPAVTPITAEGQGALRPGPSESSPSMRLENGQPSAGREAIAGGRADSEGRTLTVVVQTMTSSRGKNEPAPGVRVEVGFGLPIPPEPSVLAEVVTDATGMGQVEIPLDEITLVGQVLRDRLWVRPKQEGLQEFAVSHKLPEDGSVLELDLLLREGATLRGRLFNAQDEPVAGTVLAVPAKPGGRLGVGQSGRAGSTGWFAIHLNRGGSYDFLATGRDAGTAALRDQELDLGDLSEPLTLHLRGPGVLRGKVLGPDGRPTPVLRILAMLAEFDTETGSRDLPEPRASEVRLEGVGHVWRTARTRADGSFEIRGLRSDSYVLRARTDGSDDNELNRGGYLFLLTPTAVVSDGSLLDLRFARPYLAVRIQDEDGNPWTDGTHPRASDRDRATRSGQKWPQALRVRVIPIRESLGLPAERVVLPGRNLGGGESLYEVSDGRRFVVGLIGAGVPWKPVEVQVPKGASRVEVVLTVPTRVPTGEAAVSVFDPEGIALVRKLRIRILDEVTGFRLLSRSSFYFYRKPWPQVFELPAGNYRLVVEAAPSVDSYHGVLMSPREFGRFETTVRIQAGRRVEVQANLPAGARLAVRLRGEVLEKDRDALRKEYPDSPPSVDYWSQRARLELRREGHWPEPVYFTDDEMWAGTSAAGTHLTSDLLLGREDTSEVLSAGSYVLRAELPGGRVATRAVTLVDGQTTEVILTFE